MSRASSWLEPLLALPRQPLVLKNRGTSAVLATTIELAADSASRRRGLLGRDSLPERHALVIAPSGGIHTFFMRFPIDVVFTRRDGQVVKVVSNLKPWRIALSPAAYAVVELPAGAAGSARTTRGDFLELVLPEASRA